MYEREIWRVIGLWRIWDDVQDAVAPSERPADALLERLAETFDHRPTKDEAERAVIRAGTQMRTAFAERDAIGYLVIDDQDWRRALGEGGWLTEGVRRHPPGGRYLSQVALGYDSIVREAELRIEEFWTPAPSRSGPLLEDVAENLKSIGASMGMPPAPYAPDVPFFEGRRPAEPERRLKRSRDLDRG